MNSTASAPRMRNSRHRILVIDDNPAIHADFRKVLCPTVQTSPALHHAAAALFDRVSLAPVNPSYDIDAAASGEEGTQLLLQALEDGNPYAMAFVDMRMPNGWNGLETIRRLWQMAPGLRVVLCTAFADYSWSQIREELRDSDRLLILKKPFDSIEVQQMARALCLQAAAERH